MFYHLSPKSENVKTGPIAVTSSSKITCPPACCFRNLCYASVGKMNFVWNKITNQKLGSNFKDFCSQIKSLPANQKIRHFQMGDWPGKGNRINFKQLKQLINAGAGKISFGYSHKIVEGNSFVAKNNRRYIKYANSFSNFTINLSANNLAHADKLKKLNIGPVAAVVPVNSPDVVFTPKGNKAIKCPAFNKNITCEKCMLCAKKRNVIVMFPAHSVIKNKIEKISREYQPI